MDKVIIVTGGAGGIGSDICRGLASDGLKVVIADYAKEAAENIAAEIRKDNREAIAIQVDVGSKQSVGDMVKATLDKYGRIDFLLNGAGVLTRVPVVEMPEEDWDRVLRINLKGTFLCSQAVAHHMIPKKLGSYYKHSVRPRCGRTAARRSLCRVQSRHHRFHKIVGGGTRDL